MKVMRMNNMIGIGRMMGHRVLGVVWCKEKC